MIVVFVAVGCCMFSCGLACVQVSPIRSVRLVLPCRTKKSGGYSGGVPPLPIPNREVKPAIADGTAMQCGRVGSRLLYERVLESDWKPRLFFLCFLIQKCKKVCKLKIKMLPLHYQFITNECLGDCFLIIKKVKI